MNVLRLSKFLGSFFKRQWSLESYPVGALEQLPSESSRDLPRWVASIDGWPLYGIGENRSDALENLRKNFDEYRSARPLPRPGTRARPTFASADELERHGAFAYEFVEAVTGIRPFFMSDGTSLGDFCSGPDADQAHARIQAAYGIDSRPFEGEPLWKLLDHLKASWRDG